MASPRGNGAPAAVTPSSGNVFADLEIVESDMALAKADLAHQICEIIRSRDLTQTAAADLLGVTQPKVSALMRGRLDGFAFERLFRFLTLLDRDVRITVGSGRAKSSRAIVLRRRRTPQ